MDFDPVSYLMGASASNNNSGRAIQTDSTEATVRYVKIGDVVVVSAYGTYKSNNRIVLGNIPEPFISQFAIVYRIGENGNYGNAMVFEEDGTYKLSFYGSAPSTNTTVVCSFAYVSAPESDTNDLAGAPDSTS